MRIVSVHSHILFAGSCNKILHVSKKQTKQIAAEQTNTPMKTKTKKIDLGVFRGIIVFSWGGGGWVRSSLRQPSSSARENAWLQTHWQSSSTSGCLNSLLWQYHSVSRKKGTLIIEKILLQLREPEANSVIPCDFSYNRFPTEYNPTYKESTINKTRRKRWIEHRKKRLNSNDNNFFFL